MTGATGNIYFGLHEFADMGFLLHFLLGGDTFIDVGANIGSYTILASAVVGSRTISIEPVPSTFIYLSENIRINKIDHLMELKNAAAGSVKGKLFMTADLDTVNHVVRDGQTGGGHVEINVLPLDDLLSNERPIRLVKIDAEVFETEVIRGMTVTLRNEGLDAIIIELNGSGEHYGYHDIDIHQKIVSFGFMPFRYDPFSRELTALDGIGTENTIYLRNILFVEQRLRSAKKIKVLSEYI